MADDEETVSAVEVRRDENTPLDPKEVGPILDGDGNQISAEEASRFHERLASGEMKVLVPDEIVEELAKRGLTVEDLKAALMIGAKKSLS